MQKFLNTALGSWVKVFISAVLGQYFIMLNSGIDIFKWDITTVKALILAGAVAVLPIVINALNPSDTRYGAGSKN